MENQLKNQLKKEQPVGMGNWMETYLIMVILYVLNFLFFISIRSISPISNAIAKAGCLMMTTVLMCFSIPNIAALLFWAFGKNVNAEKSSWAKSLLIISPLFFMAVFYMFLVALAMLKIK